MENTAEFITLREATIRFNKADKTMRRLVAKLQADPQKHKYIKYVGEGPGQMQYLFDVNFLEEHFSKQAITLNYNFGEVPKIDVIDNIEMSKEGGHEVSSHPVQNYNESDLSRVDTVDSPVGLDSIDTLDIENTSSQPSHVEEDLKVQKDEEKLVQSDVMVNFLMNQIETKDKQIAEKDKQIAEGNKQIARRDQTITALISENKKKEKTIQGMMVRLALPFWRREETATKEEQKEGEIIDLVDESKENREE